MSTLREIGEHAALRKILPLLGTHPELRIGAGDDCAVCRLPGTGADQVFTTDPVIENIHFQSLENPMRIGHKAVGRVLSDIAAMGARPQWILVNVVAPPELEIHDLEKMYKGMMDLCNRFGASVIGGDLARGPALELHIFGTGLLPEKSALLRSGANEGDSILVTGPLGCSFESGKHLDFIPRVDEGCFLRESGLVNALMDISDGLATDLRHILQQSGVGAVLDGQAVPKAGTLKQALFDGEDFELLLTAPDPEELRFQWQEKFGTVLPVIGRVTAETGILRLDGQVLEAKAFEHFSPE
ncbi:thiamine-phosphate kinase [Pontiella agarivorans]|uniref:Thiamine-monophosphate kinase n=1 Tax=Pontiella agarivorans TaxID=3038953 RepID=A0ABU5N1P8_9BACT|nr:thiamine-phosphate kinase [Pontiella agarivorans]MDZ8120360.1 thiamine-phosphate kinase [Pontiella agarivorans]